MTGYMGSAGSQAITSSLSKMQPVAQLLKSSSTVTRVTTHFAIGASAEAVTGMGSRFIGTAISTGGDLEAAWDAASNVKSIVFDAMIGGVSSAGKGFQQPETAVNKLPANDPEGPASLKQVDDGVTGNTQVKSHKEIPVEELPDRIPEKPKQVHHYATDKNQKYSDRFGAIAEKYGLGLDEEWNKELLPHQGRHPNAYHEFVLDQILQIDEIAQGDVSVFLELFEDNVKAVIRENPDMLYKQFWINNMGG